MRGHTPVPLRWERRLKLETRAGVRPPVASPGHVRNAAKEAANLKPRARSAPTLWEAAHHARAVVLWKRNSRTDAADSGIHFSFIAALLLHALMHISLFAAHVCSAVGSLMASNFVQFFPARTSAGKKSDVSGDDRTRACPVVPSAASSRSAPRV